MTEAEISSVALGVVEASWLRDIIGEILGRTTDLTLVHINRAYWANLDG